MSIFTDKPKKIDQMSDAELASEIRIMRPTVKLGPSKGGTTCSISVGDKTVVMDDAWAKNARFYLDLLLAEQRRRK